MNDKSLILTDELLEAIGNRLKEARESLGLSQAEIGEGIDLGQVSISNMETGKYLITTEKLLILHKLYGFDPTYILTGESNHGLDDVTVEKFINWFKKIEKDSPVRTGASRVCKGIMISYTANSNEGK